MFTHPCPALVITCIDWRFWPAIFRFVKERLKIKNFDVLTLPGSSYNFKTKRKKQVLSDIALSFKLHQIKHVLIFNHKDCGAYAESRAFGNQDKEIKAHSNDLKRASREIKKKFPALGVELYWSFLGSRKWVGFRRVVHY